MRRDWISPIFFNGAGTIPRPRGVLQTSPVWRSQAEWDQSGKSVAVGGQPASCVEAVQKWTNGAGVDVILDLVGGDYFAPNLEALAARGRLICVGTTAGAKSEIDLGLLMRKRATIIGTRLRRRSIEEKAEATRRFASSVLPLVARGAIRPIIDRVYPANEIRDAHARMESNASFVNIGLTFA